MKTEAPEGRDGRARGFGVVPDAVPPAALAWINREVDRFIGRQREDSGDAAVAWTGTSGRRTVAGFTGGPAKLGAAALYLLGLPALAALARERCGPEAVPVHDWMVIKQPGDGRAIEWHQDFVHERAFPAVTVGLHLDALEADALRVIPDTQRERQDLCAIRARHGFDSAGVVALRAPAGGMVWHDAMLVHGSPELPAEAPVRKTCYVEFRPEAALRGHPGFPPAYVEARRRCWAAAQALCARLGDAPDGDPFARLQPEERAAITGLEAVSARIEMAHYCLPPPV